MGKYALCIGINNYPGTQNDLSGCINDAKDWADELKARGFEVTSLLDAQATKAAMAEGMRAVIGEAKYGDAVVITYSGHGGQRLSYFTTTGGSGVRSSCITQFERSKIMNASAFSSGVRAPVSQAFGNGVA